MGTESTKKSEDLDKSFENEKIRIDRIKKNSLAISIQSEFNKENNISYTVIRQESLLETILQISIPFFIASIGSIAAGVVLQSVESSQVFNLYDALYVCVSPLMGLKANLDMCLASRLSTQANLGHMTNKRNVLLMAIGNMAVVQVQAICAALFIAAFALVMTLLVYNANITIDGVLIVASSVCLTSTLSCFILDSLIVCIIYFSYKYKINPDNICAPIVASVGDVVSMTFLALFATGFNQLINRNHHWIPITLICVYLVVFLPFWIFVVKRNPFTKNILLQGWIPVLSAVVISGCAGVVLNYAVSNHRGFSSFQTVMNGVGGDIVAIHSSRITTLFHQTSDLGSLPPFTKLLVSPWSALIYGTFSAKTARLLIPISIVGQTLFVNIADLIQNSGTSRITTTFYFSYVLAVLIQVFVLLYSAHYLTHILWKFKIDPDTTAIPYLTSFADILGTSLLLSVFTFSSAIGNPYNPIT